LPNYTGQVNRFYGGPIERSTPFIVVLVKRVCIGLGICPANPHLRLAVGNQ
jgi:hypothetical protein